MERSATIISARAHTHYYGSTLIKFISAFGSTHTYVGPDLTSPPSVPPIRRRTISHRGISRTISHRGISRPKLLYVITHRRRSHGMSIIVIRWITRSSTATCGTGIIISIIIGSGGSFDRQPQRVAPAPHPAAVHGIITTTAAPVPQFHLPQLRRAARRQLRDQRGHALRAMGARLHSRSHTARTQDSAHSSRHRSSFCGTVYILLLIPHRQCQHHVLYRNPL